MTKVPDCERRLDLAAWNDEMYRRHPTPYHGLAGWVERSRVNAVLELAELTPEDRVLEIGCEGGNLLIQVPPVRRLVGGDISPQALADAAASFGRRQQTAEFVQFDAQQPLPFEPGEFSVILCSEMLEHVDQPRRVLENIAAVCTPQTRIVISIPLEELKLWLKKVLTFTRVFNLLLPGIEQGQSEWHLQVFSRQRLLDLSRDLFRPERERTVWATHYVARFRKSAGRG